jgi:putative tricarboxylic transport membrane protein
VAGLFVGAIPGLSVSMTTALLVSVTYSWSINMAMGMIMGVFVVGVFSGAVSAILINIPGAPSSVVTTLDGYPMAKQGESYKALMTATVYSFIGSVFGLVMLWFLARPITALALKFTPMDYFLLALFGLTAVGALTAKSFSKGLISAMFGLIVSMIGIDSVMGTPRLTFGIFELMAGINIVPALVGLFGFTEVLSVISEGHTDGEVSKIKKAAVKMRDILKYWTISIPACIIGTLVGALPGAGGPVASFLAYGQAKQMIKNPSRPFGEGAVEGIVASEAANNACIGGALIPMLTLAVPGDAVTAIILSVFYVHGLRPGPMFLRTSLPIFRMILAGGLLGCVFLLILGLVLGPRMTRIISIPRRLLLPVVTVLCVIGAFAGNNRIFDVVVMMVFGVIGYFMRRRDYSVAPVTLALVLGSMMDSSFRRAISLAVSEDAFFTALLWRPITLVLLALTLMVIISNIPALKRFASSRKTKKY